MRRISPEAIVVRFFQESSLDKAQSILEVCRDIVKRRGPQIKNVRKRLVNQKTGEENLTESALSTPARGRV